jgi:hypothetical protein
MSRTLPQSEAEALRCQKCGATLRSVNEDGDRTCFICGYVLHQAVQVGGSYFPLRVSKDGVCRICGGQTPYTSNNGYRATCSEACYALLMQHHRDRRRAEDGGGRAVKRSHKKKPQ